MAIYAIGDIQGCYDPLQQLLEKINFDPAQDTLWFTGDLVNRGPQSLAVLRFIKSLGRQHITVLGNHDLHLLANYYGVKKTVDQTLSPILNAPDAAELIIWLQAKPLFFFDATNHYALVHAGIAATWGIEDTLGYAHEVEMVLQKEPMLLLKSMYGNYPDQWQDALTGHDRWRVIINYLTRLRYCYADGRMDFNYKGPLADKPQTLLPWYALPNRKTSNIKIIFGHWAALQGNANCPNIYALDTGCVWGNCLTAMRLEDEVRFSVACSA